MLFERRLKFGQAADRGFVGADHTRDTILDPSSSDHTAATEKVTVVSPFSAPSKACHRYL